MRLIVVSQVRSFGIKPAASRNGPSIVVRLEKKRPTILAAHLRSESERERSNRWKGKKEREGRGDRMSLI